MLDTLFASQGRPGGSKKSALMSVLVHAAIIGAVVMGTARAVAPPEPKEKREEKIAYVAPKKVEPAPLAEAPKTPPKVRVEPRAAPKPAVKTAAPKPRPAAPNRAPVKAAPAPVAPVVVPTTIPPVSVPVPPPGPTAAELAAKAAAEAAERELAASRARAEAEAAASAAAAKQRVESESGGDVASGASYDEAEVDVAVRPLAGAPVPAYPERLRSAHVEGRVSVRFIVGTNGRVERGSIEILDSPDPAFSEEVRRVLLATRYSPAQAGGKKVRQIVEQSFTFKLQR